MSQFQRLVQRQTLPPRQRDIAAEAYSDAIKYLQNECQGNSPAMAWLETAAHTSLDDVLNTTCEAEKKYRHESQSTQSRMRWLKGLSVRIMYYGQVLDTLSQHHPEYVGLVWGAIKFVLMGIINHGNLVTQFAQALSTISHVLPITKVTAELYQTDEVKNAIANLYAHILLFLQKAFKWYNLGPTGRFFKAFRTPFELAYKETMEQIKLCAQDIDDIANIALKSEVRELSILLQEESTKLEARERHLRIMQAGFNESQAELTQMVGTILQMVTRDCVKIDEIHVNVKNMAPQVLDMHFNQVLGVLKPQRSPEECLAKHKSLIRRAPPWRNQNCDAQRLFECIGNWISAPHASLLVLRTQPRAHARAKEIATELISLLQPQTKEIIWYLSATTAHGSAITSTIEIMRTLAYQCLKVSPHIIESDPGNLSAAKLHAPHNEDEWLDLLCSIMERLPPCFIIIEAEDVMKRREDATCLSRVLQGLASRLDIANALIKLMVVDYYGVCQGLAETSSPRRKHVTVQKGAVTKRLRRPGGRSALWGLRGGSLRGVASLPR